jgi:hypothetical protein
MRAAADSIRILAVDTTEFSGRGLAMVLGAQPDMNQAAQKKPLPPSFLSG